MGISQWFGFAGMIYGRHMMGIADDGMGPTHFRVNATVDVHRSSVHACGSETSNRDSDKPISVRVR